MRPITVIHLYTFLTWTCLLLLLNGCCNLDDRQNEPFDLRKTRLSHKTTIHNDATDTSPAATPPADLFDVVHYAAPLGDQVAYVTPIRGEGRKPAVVWIAGGFDWGIGSSAWEPAPRSNDQSARAFRDAGIVLMLPALRGSNGNPGHNECFFGEVEDIIAAGAYLATREDVDPARIYLGGHSTGGTLALLTAESSDAFRAVFAFGPVASAMHYGQYGCMPSDASQREILVRSPIAAIETIRIPTFVIEGERDGNADSAIELEKWARDAPVKFLIVPDADHFSVLAPGSEVVARAILADEGPTPRFEFGVKELHDALLTPP